MSKKLDTLATNLLFVYGTLKRGFHLHGHLKTAEYLGESYTRKPLYSLDTPNEAWPAIQKGKFFVKGEVYRVDRALIDHLDIVEGVPELYERVQLKLRNYKRPAYVYCASDRLQRLLEPETTSTAIRTDEQSRTQEWIGHGKA